MKTVKQSKADFFRKYGKRKDFDRLTFYEYRTQANSYGKPVVLTRTAVDRNGLEIEVPYLAAKPYVAAHSNGDLTFHFNDQISVPKSRLLLEVMNQATSRGRLDASLDIPISEATNRAINSALTYGDVLLPVIAAEAAETRTMITGLFRRLAAFLHKLKTAVRKVKPQDILSEMEKIWLEVRYGWRPLYFDILGIHDLISAGKLDLNLLSSKGYNKVDSLATPEPHDEFVSIHPWGDSGAISLFNQVFVDEVFDTVSFNYTLNPDSDSNTLASKLGLSFRGIAQTGWDVIPFSFVVDMFLNMGEYLKISDFQGFLTPFNSSHTRVYKVTVKSSRLSGTLYQSTPVSRPYYKFSYSKNSVLRGIDRRAQIVGCNPNKGFAIVDFVHNIADYLANKPDPLHTVVDNLYNPNDPSEVIEEGPLAVTQFPHFTQDTNNHSLFPGCERRLYVLADPEESDVRLPHYFYSCWVAKDTPDWLEPIFGTSAGFTERSILDSTLKAQLKNMAFEEFTSRYNQTWYRIRGRELNCSGERVLNEITPLGVAHVVSWRYNSNGVYIPFHRPFPKDGNPYPDQGWDYRIYSYPVGSDLQANNLDHDEIITDGIFIKRTVGTPINFNFTVDYDLSPTQVIDLIALFDQVLLQRR